jgi:small conductance mechanosensitive channel
VDILPNIAEWLFLNLDAILISIISTVVVVILYYIIKKQINRLIRKESIEEATGKNIKKLLQLLSYVIIISIVTVQFASVLTVFTGLITASAATVIGFAAMNTLGNLIAGIIVIVSRPFRVGDRILFKDKISDVVDINLIYTVLEDIDGVKISIPNQKLLKEEIQNFGRHKILRREIFVTPGFEVDPRLVEKALIEAAEKFTNILKYPEPRVDLYDFLDFAVKYRLIVYINNSKIIPKFDYDLKKAVFYSCQDYNIDISTPTIIKSLKAEEKDEIYTPKEE